MSEEKQDFSTKAHNIADSITQVAAKLRQHCQPEEAPFVLRISQEIVFQAIAMSGSSSHGETEGEET